jgi:hypothetical protein
MSFKNQTGHVCCGQILWQKVPTQEARPGIQVCSAAKLDIFFSCSVCLGDCYAGKKHWSLFRRLFN